MDGTPDAASEVFRYLLENVLADVELRPGERQDLLRYMNERHGDLYGPFTTYFVLGSYEPPFKWRLEIAASELNNRMDAYAYLLAPQPDPEVGTDELLSVDDSRFPALKVKYYLHAVYADRVVLVAEHNEGGDLTELGRQNLATFFERTHLLPRGWDVDGPAEITDPDDARALAYAAAYRSTDEGELRTRVDDIADRASESGLSITAADLLADVEREFGDRLTPSYSGVVTDEFVHYARAGRCHPWLTESELRNGVDSIPK